MVKLNPEAKDVGRIFKTIAISLTVLLNTVVFAWLFFFSELINK